MTFLFRRGFPDNNVNPVETEINQKYANDMESFSVRQGCTLKIYKDANFSEDERIFTASQDQDLHMKKFKDGDKSYSKQDSFFYKLSIFFNVNFREQRRILRLLLSWLYR